jgi:RimJ/RimL family protein N-acetyltransferase
MPDERGKDVLLRTPRLVLRRFTSDDLDHLVALDSDPEVMRYLTNGRPTPYEQVRDDALPQILREYDRSPRHGRWAALDAGGEFVGWFSLHRPDGGDPDEAELGYRLRRQVWGRGLATEGARALVGKAFTELGLRRVFATTMAVNRGSRRVMEKAGLRYVRTFHLEFDDPIPGTEHGEVEYAVTAAEWAAAHRSGGRHATGGHGHRAAGSGLLRYRGAAAC